jgi:hypothetical protein
MFNTEIGKAMNVSQYSLSWKPVRSQFKPGLDSL